MCHAQTTRLVVFFLIKMPAMRNHPVSRQQAVSVPRCDTADASMVTPPRKTGGAPRWHHVGRLKYLAALLLLAAAIAPAPALAQDACGGAVTWTGVVPDCITPGANYRILFVTRSGRDARSTNIADYNTFVQDQANGATGTPFSGLTFNVLGSTEAVDARDNTDTNRFGGDGNGEPIFYYLGRRVANNYADLYDGRWGATESRDQNGAIFAGVGDGRVFTGSINNGTESFIRTFGSSAAFGRPFVATGATGTAVDQLAAFATLTGSQARSFYALSQVIRKPVADGVNICGRTQAVRDAILTISADSFCTSVSDLATIMTLDFSRGAPGGGITALQRGDFDGLTGLTILRFNQNSLTTLPANIFADLSALVELNLFNNDLNTLPVGAFAGLTSVQRLYINRNELTSLPVGIFDGLNALEDLGLANNPFTPGTGLPVGIFDDVLGTLGPVALDGGDGLAVDTVGRGAHFVCSRADVAAIVTFTGAAHCLRVTAAQFDDYLTLIDATLSGLTPSDGTLNPVFDSATTTYAVNVTNRISNVTVTPTATNAAGATITVNGAAVTSGTASVAIFLTAGTPLVIPIVVTAADGTTTMTYTVTVRSGVSVCDRTPQVQVAIIEQSSATECSSIPDLATISSIGIGGSLTALQSGDFAGMSGLTDLSIFFQPITALPAGIFAGLSALRSVDIAGNNIDTLPPDVFAGLSSVDQLLLRNNNLASLPANIFDGLDSLADLTLSGNPFTADTGLPAGIFDDVLDTLGPVAISGTSGLVVDDTVRAAHFVCSRDDVDAIVAATGVTDCIRITTAQLATYLATAATLSGLTLSAGFLNPVFNFATTTYTVLVGNSVAGVSVTPTATNATGATITVNGATVASGVTSTAIPLTVDTPLAIPIVVTAADGTTTLTYTVTATRGSPLNICDRTPAVRDAIIRESSATECSNIPDLATIGQVTISGSLTALQSGDFAGMSGLTNLAILFQPITALPAGIFAGLSALRSVDISRNNIDTLPPDVFAGLSSVEELFMNNNNLASLPANIFDGLDSLADLSLVGNSFTADTGLPAGIFDDVLGTLGPVAIIGSSGLVVDDTVRAAHFVCSHDDADAIVVAVPGVEDCIRISSAQFNAYFSAMLSGLSLSAGPLDPPFATDTRAYTVLAANNVASVTVTPIAPNADAITVNAAAVTSGSFSAAIFLTVDTPLDIPIVVTSGAVTMTYTVTVTRETLLTARCVAPLRQ